MRTMAIFLRGINVNGISIKMDELKSVIEAMRYKDVKTVLTSGNIIAATEEDELSYEEHKNRIEQGLSSYFGYEAYIFIKPAGEIHEIMEESTGHEVPEGYHHYILLTNESSIAGQLKAQFQTCGKAEKEQLILGKHGIYWIVPKGDTLQSDFGKLCLGKKEFKSKLTSRTMNTLQKMSKYL